MQRAVRVADVPSRPSKVRNAVLPQEYNMFRLLSNASFAEESWTEKTPACVWKHVECNDEGEVTKIQWRKYESAYGDKEERVSLQGSLRWNFLPDTLISFDVSLQEVLEGHVDLAVLPAGLKKFDIRTNQFSGGLDLTHLPSTLEDLSLGSNRFEGEIDLTRLPDTLKRLDLGHNSLRGKPDLTKLPEALTWAMLLHNLFVIPDFIPEGVHIEPYVRKKHPPCGYNPYSLKNRHKNIFK